MLLKQDSLFGNIRIKKTDEFEHRSIIGPSGR